MTSPGTRPEGTPAPPRIVIVGAGIAGLACAARLLDLSRERGRSYDLTVLDSAPRAGGVISTEHRDGFLVEKGPDCFITEKPWALDLCRRLGLEDQLIGTNPDCRRSFVLLRGRILPIPEGYQLMAPGRLWPFATTPILSLAGKLRAACDLILPRGAPRNDESLASFVRRRFGSEVLERLAQPLIAGIYNADPERLSLRATMPRFLEMERRDRSLILALARARRRQASSDSGVSGARYSLFVTLRGGLQVLIDRLVARLPAQALRLGTRAVSLRRERGGWTVVLEGGGKIEADAVVLAMPARGSAPLLRDVEPALADSLGSIRYGTSATVNMGYRLEEIPFPVRGFGFVVPRSERLSLIACSFSSVKFEGRARQGTILLRCFTGGVMAEQTTRDDLERAVRDDLKRSVGLTASPTLSMTSVWPKAMAQYEVGHTDRVERIESLLAGRPGLALAGNGLRGVGIPDCVHSGERAAESTATVIG